MLSRFKSAPSGAKQLSAPEESSSVAQGGSPENACLQDKATPDGVGVNGARQAT